MPSNKYAIIRYQTLDKCFRNPGKRYYFEDLLEEVNNALLYHNPDSEGIRRRQLFDDIAFMESEKGWSAPVMRIKDGRKKYYRYEDMSFSINHSPLNEREAEQIKSALLVLSRFSGLAQFEWVNELIPKLEQTFGFRSSDREIMGFESNPFVKGLEYLGPLFDAILYKKPLKIHYQSFKSDRPVTDIIHPYYLKQYSQRWYLLGQIERFETLSNRALDRIISMEEVYVPFIKNTQYDFSEYFEDVIGITVPKTGKPERIELAFVPEKAPYILTKPLHGSQKVKQNDDKGLRITIEVIINYELKSLLLSFGNEVKVLAPQRLREELWVLACPNGGKTGR